MGAASHTIWIASEHPNFVLGAHTGSHPGGYAPTEVRLLVEGAIARRDSSLSLRKHRPLGTEIATLSVATRTLRSVGRH